jgi:hypothetical protein
MKAFLIALVALIIGLILGYCYPHPTASTPRHVVVGITGGVATAINVLPDPVTVYVNDTLSWQHPTADSIVIDLEDPTLGSPAPVNQLSGSGGAAATTTIRADASAGTYKYDIIVWVGAAADTLDPRVVVKKEEGER